MSHRKFANGTRVLLCISNWLQNGFFTSHGLHYNQSFSDGQLQHDQHFLLGDFSKGQVYWATANPRIRNLASKDLQLEAFFLFFSHLSTIPIDASHNLVFG